VVTNVTFLTNFVFTTNTLAALAVQAAAVRHESRRPYDHDQRAPSKPRASRASSKPARGSSAAAPTRFLRGSETGTHHPAQRAW